VQASYSSSEVLTIIGAVGGLVTLIGGVIVNIIVTLRTNRKLDVNTAVTQDVSAKADVITGHVNGAAAAAVAKMAAQQAEIDSARLIEFHGLADALCLQELGRVPTHTDGDPVAEIILLQALNGETGPDIQAWLHEQPEAIAYRTKPVPPPIPPIIPDVRVWRGAFCIPGALPGIPSTASRGSTATATHLDAGLRLLRRCVAGRDPRGFNSAATPISSTTARHRTACTTTTIRRWPMTRRALGATSSRFGPRAWCRSSRPATTRTADRWNPIGPSRRTPTSSRSVSRCGR
jgi:hypothetical protein